MGAGRNRRKQRALRRLAMTHDCPTPQPALERSRIRPASKRRAFPPRCFADAICRHAARTVEQREVDILLWQHRQEIGERREIVRPTPQPSRFCAPYSATCRTMSANGTSAAS